MSAVHRSAFAYLARDRRLWRAAIRAAAAFLAVTAVAWGALSAAWPVAPVHVHVRWRSAVADTERIALEQRFGLIDGIRREGTSWEYQLRDPSSANIRALVQHDLVDDTEHLNRLRYRPEFAQDRSRQIVLYAGTIGAIGTVMLLLVSGIVPGWFRRSLSRLAAPVPAAAVLHDWRATVAVSVVGGLAAAGMAAFAGAPWTAAAAALLVTYACGYLAGALLVDYEDGMALAVIRTVAGLLLTTIGFLLSLVLSLPWFVGPGALVALAVWRGGRAALRWPVSPVRFRLDSAVAGTLAVVLLAPIVITFLYMAPGNFPPVFYNVDTAPVLEKVHGLVDGNTYPPESLSNVGVRRTYHYGTQAMAALIARSSGLLPHHALFLIILPLLTLGVVAAAVATARWVSPLLPRSLTVPLLLISTPSLSSTFWDKFGPQLAAAVRAGGLSIDQIVGDYGLWGILSNESKNVGGDFLILGSVAAMAAAPAWGWRLPVFLVGSACLVKAPVGVALVAGFMLAEAWRAVRAKRPWPSPQMLTAGAVFLATVAVFFRESSEPNFRMEWSSLYHLELIADAGGLSGLGLDLLWLLLPALIVWTARIADPDDRSAPLLLMGVAPILVVNVTHLEHVAASGGGAGDDWLQVLHSVPFLLHAFALSLASWRWSRLGRPRRVAVLVAVALAIAPVTVAAARYSLVLLQDPESGHEFVDNRSLADALAVIPTDDTIIVTNDLRYPAQNFARDERQMQIPALFGHQAFAVNYAYEVVPSPEQRRELQTLLQRRAWSAAIDDAARTHGWTHLLIRKDYVHPAPIPLERTFENRDYAVYRFTGEGRSR